MIITLRLVKGVYETGAGQLAAHEFGHLLGSDHDGQPSTRNTFYGEKGICKNESHSSDFKTVFCS